MLRSKVFEIIEGERDFQDQKWGTIIEHPHEIGGWLTLMRKILTDADFAWVASRDSSLEELRKLLAVGVACAEQHGIKERTNKQNNS